MAMPTRFQTMHVPAVPDHLAPDESTIRNLLAVRGGSLASCTLPAGAISRAFVHETVEEIWYCFQFRALGASDLHLLIATMPPWSGAHEALPVEGYWGAS